MHTLWVFLALATSASSLECSAACQIDVKSTHLQYPANVVVKTVYVPLTTVEVYLDRQGHTTKIERTTRSLPPQRQTLTWVHSGVTLTFPTTYAQYTGFNRIEVEPSGAVCSSKTFSLTLPGPTNWNPLIVPASAIPDPALVAPTVVQYLNSLPTVVEQVGREIGPGACKPVVGGKIRRQDQSLTLTTSAPQGALTSLTSVPEVDPTTTTIPPNSTSVPIQSQVTTGTLPSLTTSQPPSTSPETSTPSSTPPPPPSSSDPSTTPPTPPSTSTPIPSTPVTTDGGVSTSAGDTPISSSTSSQLSAPTTGSASTDSPSGSPSIPSGSSPLGPSSSVPSLSVSSSVSSSLDSSLSVPSTLESPSSNSSLTGPSSFLSRPPPASNSDIPPEATLAPSTAPGNTNLPPVATRRPTTGTNTATARTSTTDGPLEHTGGATPAHGVRKLGKLETILIAIAGLGMGLV